MEEDILNYSPTVMFRRCLMIDNRNLKTFIWSLLTEIFFFSSWKLSAGKIKCVLYTVQTKRMTSHVTDNTKFLAEK